MPSELTFDSIAFDAALSVAGNLSPAVASVVVTDPAVLAYWGVTERGSTPGQRPWPSARRKTVNSGGRIYSRQAVGGWVSKYGNVFIGYLSQEFLRVAPDGIPTQTELQNAVNTAARQTFLFLQNTAPVDRGSLRSSLDVREGS